MEGPGAERLLRSEMCQLPICIFDPGAVRESSPVGGVQSMFVHEFHSAEKLPS